MSDLTKKDFLFFQNEVLQDIKKIKLNCTEKISQLYSYIQEIVISNEKKYDSMNIIIKQLTEKDNSEKEQAILSQIDRLKRKVEDSISSNNSKISVMQKDLSNSIFKYDKIILDNLKVNGLVGDGCPYKNLNFFIIYINKIIKELLLNKDKSNNELILLKGIIKDMVTSFKTEMEKERIMTNDLINQKNIIYDEKCLERINSIEDKIKDMRMENYNYSNNLIKKTEEISIQWEKLENIKNEIYAKFDEEINKFKKNSENLLHSFNSKKEEFDVIKSRFIEVRDLIKNVRFKRNLREITNINGNNGHLSDEKKNKANNKEIKSLTKKLNFFKKQKISKKDLEKINKNFIMEDENQTSESINIEKKNNNDIKKYINKSKIQNRKKQENENKNFKKINAHINKNKEDFNKNNDEEYKISKEINFNDDNNYNIDDNIYLNENENKNNNNNENNNDNNNENENENDNYNENENDNNNYEISNNDNSYNYDIFGDLNDPNINNIKKYNNKGIIINFKRQNPITERNKINIINSKKYTKLKIKSPDNKTKIDINNKNNNEEDINIRNNTNNINNIEGYINISEKNKYININQKSDINKNDNIINNESEMNFIKIAYNKIRNNSNNNKNIIYKKNEQKLLKNMSSNEIINHKDEISKEKENNSGNSEIISKNRKRGIYNIKNRIKYFSLSEEEKTFHNPFEENKKKPILENLEKDIINYNILPLNFDDNSSSSNNNINIKLILKKINQNFNYLSFNIKEKFNSFSIDIFQNFEEIKNDINQINNEINTINSIIFKKKFLNEKHFNFQINNYDLFNNSGITLNMNNNNQKKIIKKEHYNSFFTRNKLLPKKLIEEKYETPRSILNNIEPYLIKKFKQ